MNFDFDKLREMARAKKRREGLTFRDVGRDAGIPFSTVHQILEKGRHPDAGTAVKLAGWLELSVDHFGGNGEPTVATGDTLTNIERLLKADEALRPSDRKGLMTILRTAYERAVEK